MMHVSLSSLDSHFPFSIATLYTGRSRGRYSWLTRQGPDGHRGRFLWIDVDAFNQWCQLRGYKYQLGLNELHKDSA